MRWITILSVALLAAAPLSAPLPPTHRANDGDAYAHLRYRQIGPGIAGGRVTAVAGSNRDPMLYYVGGAGGGVYRTTNGGTTFTNVFAHEPVGAIGAVTIAPQNDRTVWVGTGESNPRNDVSYGDGLFVTTDGGTHWQHRGLDRTSQIAKILVDPRDGQTAIVAALGNPWRDDPARGVYRTTDGGRHWTKTLYLGPSSGAADLAWDPAHPDTIYAAMWQYRRKPWIFTSGGTADGLYRSRDNGRTWTHLTDGLPHGLVGRIGIAVAPSDPRRVYAVIQAKSGVIWRSDDGGDRWTMVDADTLPGQRPFYFSHLRVDPRNANHVISLSMYLTESKNGGRTFRHLTEALHPDNHDLWWSADGRRIIEGNDGGYLLSNDAGNTWSAPSNVVLAQTYHVGYGSGDDYLVCTGLQDNSSWCAPSNTHNGIGVLNRDWFSIAGGDGVWAVPDPSDPSLIWTDTQDGALTIYDRHAHQSYDVSPDPRDAFTSLAGIADKPHRFNWNSPLAFSPQDPHVAYFGGNVVFRTADRGRHWTTISPDLTRNDKAHQRVSGGPITLDVSGAEYYDTILDVAPSPLAAGTMWVGTDDGLVQLTRDDGAHWTNVTPHGLPKYGRIEAVEPGHFAAGTAFVNMDRHDLGDRAPYLFATDDYGATWRSIAGNLPHDTPVRTIRQDPHVPQLLFAGTESGVWVTFDRGARWRPLKLNMPTVPVYDLRIVPQTGDLLVATHGAGIFVLDDIAALEGLHAAREQGEALFPIRPATVYEQWQPIETGDGGSLPNNMLVGPNPPNGALISFYERTKPKRRPTIEIVASDGRVVRHIGGAMQTEHGRTYAIPDAAGISRLAWDGHEDGPVRWMGTTLSNRGSAEGVEALPGTYTACLHDGVRTLTARFELRSDPDSPFTLAQLRERHDFLVGLQAQFSQVDTLLNRIDAERKRLAHRHDAERLARLASIRAMLTADDRNDEDGVTRPDRVRERLGGLMGAAGSSLAPPTAAERATAAALHGVFETTVAQARNVLRDVAVR